MLIFRFYFSFLFKEISLLWESFSAYSGKWCARGVCLSSCTLYPTSSLFMSSENKKKRHPPPPPKKPQAQPTKKTSLHTYLVVQAKDVGHASLKIFPSNYLMQGVRQRPITIHPPASQGWVSSPHLPGKVGNLVAQSSSGDSVCPKR